jgi:transposase
MSTRHRYVNTLRGILREFGVSIALGVNAAKAQIGGALAETQSEVPDGLRPILAQMLAEIRSLEEKILSIERELTVLSRSDERVQQMREIPGIGLLTSTAIRATVGDIQRFPSGRHFASWLGLTARERSSAEHRRLGGISTRRRVPANAPRARRARCTAGCPSSTMFRPALGSPQAMGAGLRKATWS